MPIHLDHALVPCRDKQKSAKQLGELLGVPYGQAHVGPFHEVYVNEGTTLAFVETDQPFPIYHFCFRVDDADFDRILARVQAAGIPYRSDVHGPDDRQISTRFGGRAFYWHEPDGHAWEALTVSYARR